jgi:hypothetical protein
MAWEVEVSDEFLLWYDDLGSEERLIVAAGVGILEQHGPELGRPYVDTLRGSAFANMKELRVQHRGRPYRILFAFDPRRNAYLILGETRRATRIGTSKQFVGLTLSTLNI